MIHHCNQVVDTLEVMSARHRQLNIYTNIYGLKGVMLIQSLLTRGRHFSLTYYQAFMAERFRMGAEERFTMLSGIAHVDAVNPKLRTFERLIVNIGPYPARHLYPRLPWRYAVDPCEARYSP